MKILFTNTALDKIKPQSKIQYYTDTQFKGLQLKVSTAGRRSFLFQRWIGGKLKKTVLGVFDAETFGVEEARAAAREEERRDQLGASRPQPAPSPKTGSIPKTSENAPLAPSDMTAVSSIPQDPDLFVSVADAMRAYWEERHPQWAETTRANALPVWRRIIAAFELVPIADLSKRGLEAFLNKEPNLKVRKRLRVQVAAFARWYSERSDSTANLIPSQIKAFSRAEKTALKVNNERFLGLGELSRLMKGLTIYQSGMDRRYAGFMIFLLATGLRLSEAADIEMSEFSADRTSLTIPGVRMKVGAAHHVHLSEMALRGLEIAGAIHETGRIWGYDPAGNVSKWRQLKLEAIADAPFVQHDFRRTIPTHLTDLGVLPHVCDAILSHTIKGGGVTAVYNRSLMVVERKEALDLWSDLLVWLESRFEKLPDMFDAPLRDQFRAWRAARNAEVAA